MGRMRTQVEAQPLGSPAGFAADLGETHSEMTDTGQHRGHVHPGQAASGDLRLAREVTQPGLSPSPWCMSADVVA